MDAEQYLRERLDDRIEWYDQMSEKNLQWYRRLRIVEVAGAALIPLLAGYVLIFGAAAVVLGILGIVVAVTAGVLGLYQFQQKCIECRAISQALRREKYLYLTRSSPYDVGHEPEHIRVLVQRADEIIVDEQGRQLDRFGPEVQPRRGMREDTDPIHAAAE